jgi:hypothetical protein
MASSSSLPASKAKAKRTVTPLPLSEIPQFPHRNLPAKKPNPRLRRVRLNVESGDNVRSLGRLLKEVLRQIPADQAKALAKCYVDGKSIIVAMAQSRFGVTSKTAFGCAASDAPLDLVFQRGPIPLPEPKGTRCN